MAPRENPVTHAHPCPLCTAAKWDSGMTGVAGRARRTAKSRMRSHPHSTERTTTGNAPRAAQTPPARSAHAETLVGMHGGRGACSNFRAPRRGKTQQRLHRIDGSGRRPLHARAAPATRPPAPPPPKHPPLMPHPTADVVVRRGAQATAIRRCTNVGQRHVRMFGARVHRTTHTQRRASPRVVPV